MGKKIDEELKSSNFRNESHKALLNLLVTASWLQNASGSLFKKYDLTAQQFNVLRILRGQFPKPCTVLSIRERMIDKMSDVSRIVERLRLSGFVDRVLCAKDRRAVDVIITEKGLELLKRMDKEDSYTDELMNNLSKEETIQLNELLDKLRK
jgi:DNA-binding MarR family transcriptional regulator